MPKKILHSENMPTLVQERMHVWGQCIKKQRISQKFRAEDLCARIDISDATLRRLEKGDPGADAGIYLSALLVLGLLDQAAPLLANHLWVADSRSRVRLSAQETDDVYF